MGGVSKVWDCSLDEFVNKVVPVLEKKIVDGSVENYIASTAISVLRERFDKGELTGTVENEVDDVLEYACLYHQNMFREDL